jgi:adenylate kinase family enzyme
VRLHIFGASGSGVTTLGRALSQELRIPYFDSDDYFWKKSDPPFLLRQNAAERNALINDDLKANHWIFGGSSMNWGNEFPEFDLIVFLWIPADIRIQRLKQREWERYGEVIYTQPERNKQFNEFIAWAADYDTNTGISNRTLDAHEKWLLTKRDTPIIELRGDLSVEERVTIIKKRLKLI